MHLVGQLSNPSSSLERVLSAPVPNRPPALSLIPPPPAGRLGNGTVQRAVVKVLRAADEPFRALSVKAAVEDLLGRPVSANSIHWCLSTGVQGPMPRFERVAHGCYQLRRDSSDT